jgi:integrase
MNENLKVSFYLKRTKAIKLCPVMGRITVGQTVAQFGAKLEVDVSKWDAKAGRMTGKSAFAQEVNRKIDGINLGIHARYNEILTVKGKVSAEEVKNAFQGIASVQETLMKVFAEHNETFQKRIGIDREATTVKKYRNAYRHLSNFLKEKYHVPDMPFKQLNFAFIESFDFYLRIEHRMKPNTVLRSIIPLRKIVKIALNKGYIAHDPFSEYKPERGKSEHRTLTGEELQSIMNTPFYSDFRNLTLDIFVFSAFTGLAYSDIKNLTEKELVTTDDGNRWIVTARKKTGTISRIRLLDIPIRLIEKYEKERTDDKVFPVPAYTTVDINLKRIDEICGINKRISFHQARHTYSSCRL